MSKALDQIILRLEFVKDRAEDDEVICLLNDIIDDLCEWEDENFPEDEGEKR